MPSGIRVFVEGRADEHIIRHLLAHCEITATPIKATGGKQLLIKDYLPKVTAAAQYHNQAALIVLDLDQEACAVTYLQELLETVPPLLSIRVAVREIEAWLMADREHCAKFFRIPVGKLPEEPETILDPKTHLLNLIQGSSNQKIKRDMLPYKTGGRVGPGYTTRIQEFMTHPQYPWRPDVAAQTADSLARCIRALRELKTR